MAVLLPGVVVLLALNKEDKYPLSPYGPFLQVDALAVLLAAVLPLVRWPDLNKEEANTRIRFLDHLTKWEGSLILLRLPHLTLPADALVPVLNKEEATTQSTLPPRKVVAVAALLVAVLLPVRWPDRNKEGRCRLRHRQHLRPDLTKS